VSYLPTHLNPSTHHYKCHHHHNQHHHHHLHHLYLYYHHHHHHHHRHYHLGSFGSEASLMDGVNKIGIEEYFVKDNKRYSVKSQLRDVSPVDDSIHDGRVSVRLFIHFSFLFFITNLNPALAQTLGLTETIILTVILLTVTLYPTLTLI
jgi:hypothetical protein